MQISKRTHSIPKLRSLFTAKNRKKSERGFALILVLAAIFLVTVIVVGFLAAAQYNRQSAVSSANSLRSDLIIQAAMSHATALLANNIPPVSNPVTGPSLQSTTPINWWVNPGLLSLQTANNMPVPIRLYTTDPNNPPSTTTYPPADQQPNDFVDLNRPLLSNSTVRLITGNDTSQPGNNAPMKVAWNYILQNPNKPHQNNSTLPNYNPYVGRYGFWMEPENSKLDITTALGKDPAQPLPDAAPTLSGTPTYAQPTMNSHGKLNPNNSVWDSTIYLGNPLTVDLGVLNDNPNGNLLWDNLANSQTAILRGVGDKDWIGLPLFGNTNPIYPPTLDDVEQIKNFVTAGNGDAFYDQNRFYLTNYSRDPEFNAFGGSRLFSNEFNDASKGGGSWYSSYGNFPTYQSSFNSDYPLWLEAGGGSGSTGRNLAAVLYLSSLMQNKHWPGYDGNAMCQKWVTASTSQDPNRAAREADQVASNVYGMLTRMQDGLNNDNGQNEVGGGTQGKFYLFNKNTWGSQPNYSTYGALYWNGTLQTPGSSSGALYPAQGSSLISDEFGFRISITTVNPKGQDTSQAQYMPTEYYIHFSFKAGLWAPPGFFPGGTSGTVPGTSFASVPLSVPVSPTQNYTTTVHVMQLQYAVNGSAPHIYSNDPNVYGWLGLETQGFSYSYYNSGNGPLVAYASSGGGAISLTPTNPYMAFTSGTDYVDPTPVSVNNPTIITQLRAKICVTTQPYGFAIQTSPSRYQPSNPATTSSSIPEYYSSNGAPGLITFPDTDADGETTWGIGGLTPTTPMTHFESMKLKDDPRLWGAADIQSSGLASGWQPTAGGYNFGSANAQSPTNLSKLALAPINLFGAYMPDETNDYNSLSAGYVFYASTGMQGGVPWQTLSLQPGGGNPAAITSARNVSPPDYLLLDLLYTPYRCTALNSTCGKVNINSLIYPSYFGVKRLLPLEALFLNTNVSGVKIDQTEAQNLATAIQKEETALQGFRYSGELCEVTELENVATMQSEYQKEALMRNLAGLITTRSNSFGLWGAAETVKELKDGTFLVTSEKRFHAIIERYVWSGKDGQYGNAFVDPTSGQCTLGAPGGYKDQIDGPDPVSISTVFNFPPYITSPNTSISLDMTNPDGSTPSSVPTIVTSLEQAYNPFYPYMRYKIVNFKYLTD